MDRPNLKLAASAVLLWLPPGEEPDADSSVVASPPYPNPEGWWRLDQAIRYAIELDHTDGKLPWIKTDDILLRPDEISEVYENMGNVGRIPHA